MQTAFTHHEIVELIRYMTPAERSRFDSIMACKPMFAANAGPQTMLIETPADMIFYGGSAGGGKTFGVLGLAVTQHKRSLLLRRESTQLRGLIEDARKIIGDKGRLNENTGVYRLNNGRILELAGCKDEKDKHRFDGRPHDLIAVDEAPQFAESQIAHIIGWARTEDPNQRVRIVLTGNPPSEPEGEWVVRWFAPWLDPNYDNPARPGELRWFARINGEDKEVDSPEPFTLKIERGGVQVEEVIKPKSRTFIPARVQDNPAYMASDYVSQLQSLPEPLRSQLLYGDFKAGMEDNAWQAIPSQWVDDAFNRYRALYPTGNFTAPSNTTLTSIGVDVARGGQDKTVLSRRYGWVFAPLEAHAGKATDDGLKVAALITKAVIEAKIPAAIPAAAQPYINVDVIGVGSSAYDIAKTQIKNVVPINVGAGAWGKDKAKVLSFRNLRAYAVWRLRELLDPNNGHNLALPPSNTLKADLCAARWKQTTQGVQIESKDDIKKRIGRSPDEGDAIMLAALERRSNGLHDWE